MTVKLLVPQNPQRPKNAPVRCEETESSSTLALRADFLSLRYWLTTSAL